MTTKLPRISSKDEMNSHLRICFSVLLVVRMPLTLSLGAAYMTSPFRIAIHKKKRGRKKKAKLYSFYPGL